MELMKWRCDLFICAIREEVICQWSWVLGESPPESVPKLEIHQTRCFQLSMFLIKVTKVLKIYIFKFCKVFGNKWNLQFIIYGLFYGMIYGTLSFEGEMKWSLALGGFFQIGGGTFIHVPHVDLSPPPSPSLLVCVCTHAHARTHTHAHTHTRHMMTQLHTLTFIRIAK